jgi:hypothetical protein
MKKRTLNDGTTKPVQKQKEMLKKGRQQDDASARAKGSGHGKKTADKWNQ